MFTTGAQNFPSTITVNAFDSGDDVLKEAGCYFTDHSRLLLLYFKIHKVASEKPESQITFNFFPSESYKNKQDNLKALHRLFKNHPKLLPRNLTLHLKICIEGEDYSSDDEVYRSDGEDYSENYRLHDIKGIGDIDYNYQANILKLIAAAGLLSSRGFVNLEAIFRADSGKMTQFLVSRNGNLLPDFEVCKSKFTQNYLKFKSQYTDDLCIEFLEEIISLKNLLLDDIDDQIKKQFPHKTINNSTAVKILAHTAQLLSDLCTQKDYTERLKLLNDYETKCKTKPKYATYAKVITAVIIAAVGLVVGAVVGGAIGFGVGVLTGGPLAALTGPLGIFKGSLVGWALGFKLGVLATGLTAGSISGALFFRQSKLNNDLKRFKQKGKAAIYHQKVFEPEGSAENADSRQAEPSRPYSPPPIN